MNRLYHGTTIAGLTQIMANSKSHSQDLPVAYFSRDRVYALLCCRTPAENFVTAGLREDGKLHYFERFPNQLHVMYCGKAGYLYYLYAEDSLQNTSGHTYESPVDVAVDGFEYVEDVYSEIMAEEAAGNLIIHRYEDIDPAEQKMMANHIRDTLHEQPEMEAFYRRNFGELWD